MGASRENDLKQLRELAAELGKLESIEHEIDMLHKRIENSKQRASCEVMEEEENIKNEFKRSNWKRAAVRGRIIRNIFVILLLAASLLSFYVLVPAMKASSYVVEGKVFFCVIHGLVCLGTIILSVWLSRR